MVDNLELLKPSRTFRRVVKKLRVDVGFTDRYLRQVMTEFQDLNEVLHNRVDVWVAVAEVRKVTLKR